MWAVYFNIGAERASRHIASSDDPGAHRAQRLHLYSPPDRRRHHRRGRGRRAGPPPSRRARRPYRHQHRPRRSSAVRRSISSATPCSSVCRHRTCRFPPCRAGPFGPARAGHGDRHAAGPLSRHHRHPDCRRRLGMAVARPPQDRGRAIVTDELKAPKISTEGGDDHAWPQSQNDRRRMPRRHAQGLRRHPCVHGAGGAAADFRRDGAAHLDRAHPHPRREIRRLHGRRLRPRLRQARHLHGAGDRRAQSRRRAARRLARAFAGHRDDWRARRQDQVPQGLPGDRRRAGVRAGDQVQRHHRRRRALPRHGAAGVPRRHDRHARPGASAIPRQRGPGRRRGSRDGAAGGAALRARAAVPSRAPTTPACARRCFAWRRPSGR